MRLNFAISTLVAATRVVVSTSTAALSDDAASDTPPSTTTAKEVPSTSYKPINRYANDSSASRRQRLADQVLLRRNQRQQSKTSAAADDNRQNDDDVFLMNDDGVQEAAVHGTGDGGSYATDDDDESRSLESDEALADQAGPAARATAVRSAIRRAVPPPSSGFLPALAAARVGLHDADDDADVAPVQQLLLQKEREKQQTEEVGPPFGNRNQKQALRLPTGPDEASHKKKSKDWRDIGDDDILLRELGLEPRGGLASKEKKEGGRHSTSKVALDANVDAGLLSLSSVSVSDSTEGHGYPRELSSHCPAGYVDCYEGNVRGTSTPCNHPTYPAACGTYCCIGDRACESTTACIKKDGSCNGDTACFGTGFSSSYDIYISGPSCIGNRACQIMFYGNTNSGMVSLTKSCLCDNSCFEPLEFHCGVKPPGPVGATPLQGLPACGASFSYIIGRTGYNDCVSFAPSSMPSFEPSGDPSIFPSVLPSSLPSVNPTTSHSPSASPSKVPSAVPSSSPSSEPSGVPSLGPSSSPSSKPSSDPSSHPSSSPSSSPSSEPSLSPSFAPSRAPSNAPSVFPSVLPSKMPSAVPSRDPSSIPSKLPSTSPSEVPSISPSRTPSTLPSVRPSLTPSKLPSSNPSAAPSSGPSKSPAPSAMPTRQKGTKSGNPGSSTKSSKSSKEKWRNNRHRKEDLFLGGGRARAKKGKRS